MDRISHQSCARSSSRIGFSMVDLISGTVLCLIVLLVMLQHVQRQRELARRDACDNNLRQIGIAILNYEATFGQLPRHGTGTHNLQSAQADAGDPNGKGGGNNGMMLSFLVSILPFMEEQEIWEQIANPSQLTVSGPNNLSGRNAWNAMGPAPWQKEYRPWMTEVAKYRCPSDTAKGAPAMGRTNYAACLGDAVDFQTDSAFRFHKEEKRWKVDPLAQKRVRAAARGIFVYRHNIRIQDITDGVARTIAVGEIATHAGNLDKRTNPAVGYGDMWSGVPPMGGIFDNARAAEDAGHVNFERPLEWFDRNKSPQAPTLTKGADEKRGCRWADARTVFTGFTTILPPNTEVALERTGVGGCAVASMSSRHRGGGHVLWLDGATNFITDSIECGDVRSGTVRFGMKGDNAPGSKSTYGLWGAIGTRDSQEEFDSTIFRE